MFVLLNKYDQSGKFEIYSHKGVEYTIFPTTSNFSDYECAKQYAASLAKKYQLKGYIECCAGHKPVWVNVMEECHKCGSTKLDPCGRGGKRCTTCGHTFETN